MSDITRERSARALSRAWPGGVLWLARDHTPDKGDADLTDVVHQGQELVSGHDRPLLAAAQRGPPSARPRPRTNAVQRITPAAAGGSRAPWRSGAPVCTPCVTYNGLSEVGLCAAVASPPGQRVRQPVRCSRSRAPSLGAVQTCLPSLALHDAWTARAGTACSAGEGSEGALEGELVGGRGWRREERALVSDHRVNSLKINGLIS